jgi:ribosome-associated toxin RatA of RatAB toxin-antitoxin module
VSIIPHFSKSARLLNVGISAIALAASLTLTPAASIATSNPIAQLPAQEQATLRSGDAYLTGQNGQYTCRILVKAPVATAWKVLTDYNNFKNFLPNVTASQVVESKGNRKVFEQVYTIQALIFSQDSRVRIAATESYPKKIDFQMVDGDLDSLKGVWRIEPVSANQVLITHQVTVTPKTKKNQALFYGIYEDTLENTLRAVKQQAEKLAS